MFTSDPQIWNQFISTNGGDFLQSFEWGEFQKSLDRKIWRLGIEENGTLIAVALVVKMPLPLGQSYLYSPRGPIFLSPPVREGDTDGVEEDRFKKILDEIKLLAKKEGCIFYRLEPIKILPTTNCQLLPSYGGQRITQTVIFDITSSPENLLNSFHPKTRYNIRLSEKHGVTIREGKTDADFEIFWDLMTKTASRQKIRTHPKEYYKKISNIQYPILKSKIFIASHKNNPIAANLCLIFDKTFYYLHGGSDNEYRQLMAPHLLQWRQIETAKILGCKKYDFWGFDEKKWPGVSRFKAGFNGEIVKYPGTFDLPIDKLRYRLYSLVKKMRRR